MQSAWRSDSGKAGYMSRWSTQVCSSHLEGCRLFAPIKDSGSTHYATTHGCEGLFPGVPGHASTLMPQACWQVCHKQ